jgi:RNA polymerase sigma-70 factor (ECF subfamily)
MYVLATTDEQLVELAKDGDRAAFETLLRPLISPGYRLAMVMVRDPHQAEDCVQEAALRAWRGRTQLKGGAPSLRPWFLAIVANECRSWRRGRWARVLQGDLTPLTAAELRVTEEALAQTEDLRRALRTLKPEERAALLLRYGLGLEVNAVAAALSLRPAAARSRIHRALRRLRPHLELEEADDNDS